MATYQAYDSTPDWVKRAYGGSGGITAGNPVAGGGSPSSSSGGSSSSLSSGSSGSSFGGSSPYLGGYTNPDDYAAAIKRVISSGGTFQNPVEAGAFMSKNPQYNWNSPAGQTQQGNYTTMPINQPNPVIQNQPVQQNQPATVQNGTFPNTQSNPYRIPIRNWFESLGQTVNYDSGNITTSGGFKFAPGTYAEENGTSYVDPLTLAGKYIGQPTKQLTPETYNQYAETAGKVLEPQRQLRLNALKEILGQRQQSNRQSAINRGTYTSPTYDENIMQNVEKPYADDVTRLEGEMAALVNTNAMNEFNQQRSAEQQLTDRIVSYLTGTDQIGRDEQWKRILQSIAMANTSLSA